MYLVRDQCELQVGWELVSYVNVIKQMNVCTQQLRARNWQLIVGINDLRALTDPGLLKLRLSFIGLVTAVVYRFLQVTSRVWRFYAYIPEEMPTTYKISCIATFWIRNILTLRCWLAVSEDLYSSVSENEIRSSKADAFISTVLQDIHIIRLVYNTPISSMEPER